MPSELIPAALFMLAQFIAAAALLIRQASRTHHIGADHEDDPYPHVPR